MHQCSNHDGNHPVPSVLYRKKHDGKLLKYDILEEIGKGGFGVVYSAIESPSKMKVALKCTPKSRLESQKIKKKLINEMTIHRSLNHPNIVKFLGTFHDEYYIYFILELCEGGNVLEYIKNFNTNNNKRKYKAQYNYNSRFFNDQNGIVYLPEYEVIKITKQVLLALDYLHLHARVIHRDIKLQNFLMTNDGVVKLSDFGLSINFDDVSDKSSVVSICGTPNYISPEVIDRDSHTSAVDIWGVGVIVFLMLTGQRPFKSSNNKKTFERIRQVHYDWPRWPAVSEQAKSFVDSILKKNPLERPTARKLLKHPFLCLSTEKSTNKKANSFDSSIKFTNVNTSHISTSTYASSSTSNAPSNRSSSVSPSVLSSNSNHNSNSPSHNSNEAYRFTQNQQNNSPLSLNPQSVVPNDSKKIQNRSKSPERPVNYGNLSSQDKKTLNLKKRSFSPSRPVIYASIESNISRNNSQFTSNHSSLLATDHLTSSQSPKKRSVSPVPKSNTSRHTIFQKDPYYMPRDKNSNKKISEMIIPNIQMSDIKEEIWWEEHYHKLQKIKQKNDDFKHEQSSSIIIKATIETIEDAAKQAEKEKQYQGINQNNSRQSTKILGKHSAEQPKASKLLVDGKLAASSVVRSNLQDDLDYRIDYGIIPSAHSSAFPSCSVLLWWDYSSRYGLGYILYNGCVGVCFNDLSRIIMEPTERFAQFYSKPNSKMEIVKLDDYSAESNEFSNGKQKNDNVDKNDVNNSRNNSSKAKNDDILNSSNKSQTNSIKIKKDFSNQDDVNPSFNEIIDKENDSIIKNEFNNPKADSKNESAQPSITLPNKKKILIVRHFAKNLKKIAMKYIDSSIIRFQEDSDSLFEKMKSVQLDYIKYWGTNKKDGILFKLNGKSLQASFPDKTSLYICADSKNLIYDDTNIVYNVALRDLVGNNNNKLNSIQSKFLIAKELGKNLE